MTDTAIPAPAEAAAPEPVPNTVEAVLAERRAKRPEGQAPEPAPAAATPETPSAGDHPAESEGEAETPAADGDAEAAEPAEPAARAPQYWSKEAKAAFAELPPELQAVVAREEATGESVRGKAKQEAAEARKAADKEAGAYRERASRLGELLPQLETSLATKWDGVTPAVWAEVARTDATKYAVLKADYEADQATLKAAKDEHAQAEAARHDQHVVSLVETLPDVAPELADPKEGPKRLQAVFSYLGTQGISRDALKWVTAPELAIAHKAMLFDQGQSALKAAPAKDPKPASPPLRPAAAQPGSSTQQRLASLDAKAAKSGRFEDVQAARKARREAQKG